MDMGKAPHFLAQARREAAQAELARRVGRRERRRRPAAERDHVDEDAALPLEEAGQDGVGAVDRAEQVHLDRAAMQIERRVLERAEHAGAGIVDPGVDAPEALLRHPRQGLDRLRIGHVRRNGQGRGAEPRAFLREPLQRLAAPSGGDDVGALAGEGEGGGAADAARGAGDDDDGAVQVSHDRLPVKASGLRRAEASVRVRRKIR